MIVSGETKNNEWGGLNVNNKQYEGTNLGWEFQTINVTHLVSSEPAMAVIESYYEDGEAHVIYGIIKGLPYETDKIHIYNNELKALNIQADDENLFDRLIMLNPENTKEQNGAILGKELNRSVEGNNIHFYIFAFDEYFVGKVNTAAPVTLTCDNSAAKARISEIDYLMTVFVSSAENITIPENYEDDIRLEIVNISSDSPGSGSGTGNATVIDPDKPLDEIKNETAGGSKPVGNGSQMAGINDTRPEPFAEEKTSFPWQILIPMLLVIAVAVGFYVYNKNKQKP